MTVAATNARVRIGAGELQGVPERNVLAFRGIPYATPPVGNLRFAAPQAVAPWPGTRDATRSGSAPPQNAGVMLGGRPVGATAEDCLYLEVYTPALDGRRPVMLWLYGGGFVAGSGSDVLTNGHRLARHGDVVVVTCNYRLGALGFLAGDDATDTVGAAVSNAGLLDQIAVLRWIRAEIHHFGGDPDCVTLFGESAGGMSVCNLLAAPAARGLFHRAIAQSGFAASVQTGAAARDVRSQLCAALGVADGDTQALRECATDQLLAAQQQVLIATRRKYRGMAFRPAIDHASLPEVPLSAIAAGRAADVPMLLGTNLDEQRLYMSPRQDLTDAELLAHIVQRLRQSGVDPAFAPNAVALYQRTRPEAEYASNAAIACAVDTDLSFRVPALRLARARLSAAVSAKTWMYLLTWKSPALRGWLAACHAIDVPFVFGNLDTPGMRRFAGSGAAADALAGQMMTDWTHFARTGQPAAHDWEPYAAPVRRTMLYGPHAAVVAAPYEEERQFWAQLLNEPL